MTWWLGSLSSWSIQGRGCPSTLTAAVRLLDPSHDAGNVSFTSCCCWMPAISLSMPSRCLCICRTCMLTSEVVVVYLYCKGACRLSGLKKLFQQPFDSSYNIFSVKLCWRLYVEKHTFNYWLMLKYEVFYCVSRFEMQSIFFFSSLHAWIIITSFLKNWSWIM